MSEGYLWQPSPEIIENSNMIAFMRRHDIPDFPALVARADDDPEWFWNAIIDRLAIPFSTPYEKVLDLSDGIAWPKWCVGGETNVTASCLVRHRDTETYDRPAISWESEVGDVKSWSYRDLDHKTSQLAEGLRSLGLGPGDAIGMYLPMSCEVVAAFYAILHIGAVAVPLFSGFGAEAIAARLNDSGAKAVITADGSRRRGAVIDMKGIMDEAVEKIPTLKLVIVLDYLGGEPELKPGRDIAWRALAEGRAEASTPEPVPADDPAVLIYTSGTTGKPKGTIITHCGLAVKPTLDFWLCHDVKPEDRLIWLTDFGWAVGPMISVAVAGIGASLVLAEGGPDYPDPGRMWRLIDEHGATVLGTAPTAIRALMRYGAEEVEKHDLSRLKGIASTGEPWTDEAWHWTFEHVCKRRIPILNWTGGTEIGGGILCGNVLTPLKPCAFAGPIPGMAADVVDEAGNSVGPGEVGELVLRAPSIGLSRGLWKDS